MQEKLNKKYRTTSARKPFWDYGSHGLYFVTICTKDRLNYFGEIKEIQNMVSLQETAIGSVATINWLAIPQHFSFIEIDYFVVMPNHLHGILFINKPDKTDWQLNKFGVQSANLASVIRGYKASVKTYATKNNIDFSWQPKYHDRVIRDEKEYNNIRDYIYHNPQQWMLNGDDKNDLFL